MYIEEYLEQQRHPIAKAGLPLDTEYTPIAIGQKTRVYKRLAGCVFIGSSKEARQYIAQQRTKQAIARAEKELRRGSNPFTIR